MQQSESEVRVVPQQILLICGGADVFDDEEDPFGHGGELIY